MTKFFLLLDVFQIQTCYCKRIAKLKKYAYHRQHTLALIYRNGDIKIIILFFFVNVYFELFKSQIQINVFG